MSTLLLMLLAYQHHYSVFLWQCSGYLDNKTIFFTMATSELHNIMMIKKPDPTMVVGQLVDIGWNDNFWSLGIQSASEIFNLKKA